MAQRKSKKVAAQYVVGTATAGLPQPVRNVVGSRWGSRLAILVAIALFATGIASLDWSSGWPRLKIDRARAQQVGHEIHERAESVADHALENYR